VIANRTALFNTRYFGRGGFGTPALAAALSGFGTLGFWRSGEAFMNIAFSPPPFE
jgi:hypothetical protein